MQIHLNLRNLTIAIVICTFTFIGYVILTSGERFPDVLIELRDVISYAVLAVEVGGRAIARVNEERSLGIIRRGKTAEGKDEFVTKADLVSNFLILDAFRRFPGIQVITEEKNSEVKDSDVQRYRADSYELWLSVREIIDKLPSRKLKLSKLAIWVDPLDATQEFTEGLLEYVTVMICIAFEGRPIFGVIYRPFFNETVFGLDGYGVINANGTKWEPTVLQNAPKKILISRSHAGSVEGLINKTFGEEYSIEGAGGSGYKTLRLINGTAQFYLHRTAIKKWDTCAADAIITAVGGAMIDLHGYQIDYSATAPVRIDEGLLVAPKNPFTLFQRLRTAVY
uniref:inositol-phosphate phosphatase n=1 Tax=Ascaris suum TaxID=6253 RepID=F1LAR7_ASCSU